MKYFVLEEMNVVEVGWILFPCIVLIRWYRRVAVLDNIGLQLLETEYCHTIRNEIEKYCTKLNSIPALLATITLDNFQSPCGPTPGTSGLT